MLPTVIELVTNFYYIVSYFVSINNIFNYKNWCFILVSNSINKVTKIVAKDLSNLFYFDMF